MKIAVDAFGGDNAPDEVIKGAVQAVERFDVGIILTGDEKLLKARFEDLKLSQKNITIADADGIIEIEDNPMDIRKEKKNCSMGVAFQKLVSGEADAFVSAGSTAAIVCGGATVVGRIKGVKRPALAPIVPGFDGRYMLLDAGANDECRPEMLLQFGILGSVYMNRIMKIDSPRVGLLNIGAEEEKGRELEHGAYALLQSSGLNFIGNVEARGVPMNACDVVVTDGFTGNVLLKSIEGMGVFMKKSLKELFYKNIATKIGAAFTLKGIKALSAKMDYKEVGGSPLLGTAKPVIKAHGSSDAKAFFNAIRQAKEFVENDVIEEMTGAVKAAKTANGQESAE